MLWINFLHFYQPATLDREVIIEAIEKSYRRIIKALQKNSNVRFTVNVQGCLLEKMHELGYQMLLRDLKQLAERGQLEFVGSAAFHPILPLIPAFEAVAQIKLQEEIIKKYFGDVKLKGFFLPEMAYAPKTAKLLKNLGYEWIILDEISARGTTNGAYCQRPYRDAASGLSVVFRNRAVSQSYVPRSVAELAAEKSEQTLITATDAELYGLRHADISGHFEKILKRTDVTTQTISGFLAEHEPTQNITILRSSWESAPAELRAQLPYALWYNKKNVIQMKLWQLARLALETAQRHTRDPQYRWAAWRLHRGLSSCTFWWASGKKISVWSAASWNPDEIDRGLDELIKAVRALDDATTRLTKLKAEKLYVEIKQLIWNKHWTHYWKVAK
ncbi:hypothetical protein A2477_02470 [Candidatus Falkowbacteria bacterium RIFOXYC2_FULL_47_12]|uniref:Glycoside hydrolase family 57 N-terminal domain-containing protein n=1 Tax=Candidatus Falkowbacteria bacterium RIFOXYC2_FULL_47_12 TaxID=1798004 RepID=A0A1F5TMH0_9BACT|nr:MAG: hypothetical protein A2477_02470 [Candidatus Falkowbacteria bacterium RIFOXYC2_FULL_47_12]